MVNSKKSKKLWFLDLETYSPVDLRRCGAWRYAEESDILMVVIAEETGHPRLFTEDTLEYGIHLVKKITEDPENNRFVIHNGLGFDVPVLAKNGCIIPPAMVIDTAARARLHALPASLGDLCKYYELSDNAAKKSGARAIRWFCIPGPDGNRRLPSSNTHLWEEFCDYAIRDVEALRTIYSLLPTVNVSPFEKELQTLDYLMNRQGYRIAVDDARRICTLLQEAKLHATQRIQDLSGGTITTPRQLVRIKKLLASYGCNTEKLDKNTVEAHLDNPALHPQAVALLDAVAASSLSSTAKYEVLSNAVGKDNRLRGTLIYRGASRTGRWSGALFQPQNLPSREILSAEKVAEGLAVLAETEKLPEGVSTTLFAKSALRPMVLPDFGQQLFIVDYANIEGRIQAWLAKETWKLDAFAAYDAGTGPDLYKLAYSRAFHIPVASVTPFQRQIGKVMELALGYQGGLGAFRKMAETYGINLDELSQTVCLPEHVQADVERRLEDLDPVAVACTGLVRLWRDQHRGIVRCWGEMEHYFRQALPVPETSTTQNHVAISLPSGRNLLYHRPSVTETGLTYYGKLPTGPKFGTLNTYGGKLFENVCQAVAADILADRLLAVTKTIPHQLAWPILTVHDEIVFTICKEFDVNLVLDVLKTPPSWAPELPLAVTHRIGERYGK